MIHVMPVMSSSAPPTTQTSQSCAPPSIYAPMRRCPVRKFKRTFSNTSSSRDTQIRTNKKIIMQSNNNNKINCIGDVMSQHLQNDKPTYVNVITRRRVVSVSNFCVYEVFFVTK